eukprot:scaffold54202_cov15-Tisochrysis_lutea.AAC.1
MQICASMGIEQDCIKLGRRMRGVTCPYCRSCNMVTILSFLRARLAPALQCNRSAITRLSLRVRLLARLPVSLPDFCSCSWSAPLLNETRRLAYHEPEGNPGSSFCVQQTSWNIVIFNMLSSTLTPCVIAHKKIGRHDIAKASVCNWLSVLYTES